MSSGTREGMPSGARARHRADMRQLVRKSLTLTTLSTVVPGLGLTWTRYRRLGWLAVAVTVLVALVVAGGVLFYGAGQAVLAVAVRPSVLLAVAGGLLLVGMVSISASCSPTATPWTSASTGVSERGFGCSRC